MPGVVAAASASTVLPALLCSSFTRTVAWPVEDNVYRNGEAQRRARTAEGRNTWALAPKLPASVHAALKAFFAARGGPKEAFYYYDPHDGTHDPTGVATTGRYKVRFADSLSLSIGMARGDGQLGLIEVA